MHSAFRARRLPELLSVLLAICIGHSASAQDGKSGRSAAGDPTMIVESMLPVASAFGEGRSDADPLPVRNTASFSGTFVSVGVSPEADLPTGLVFTPDGSEIIVAYHESNCLVVYDAATRAALQTIFLSGGPKEVVVDGTGTWAVTANLAEDTASVVNLATGAEIATLPVGDIPVMARVTPDGTRAIIGSAGADTLSVIDIAGATVVQTITGVDHDHKALVVSSNGAAYDLWNTFAANDSHALVVRLFGDEIMYCDLSTGTVSTEVAADPSGPAISADGSTAVVHLGGNPGSLAVIDMASLAITKTISLGANSPIGRCAVNADGTVGMVSTTGGVYVVDLSTDAVSGPLAVGISFVRNTFDDSLALFSAGQAPLVSFASGTVLASPNTSGLPAATVATSPTDERAAGIDPILSDGLIVFSTNGALAALEGVVAAGPSPEADRALRAAITPDGALAVVVNQMSDNVSIVDVMTATVLAIVDVGDSPKEVAITPDGSRALVSHTDASFVSSVDLMTHVRTDISTSSRSGQIVISTDGTRAYVADPLSDGVWRIDLSTDTTLGAMLSVGNMGGVGGPFSQGSGIALSHDNQTLVTCNSFSDSISIIDTAAWSVVATVPVGTFPQAAVFSADDSTIYVTNNDSGTVSAISNSGAASSVSSTITVAANPRELAVNPAETRLFVADDTGVSVVNLPGTAVSATIPTTDTCFFLHLTASGNFLLAGTGSASFGGLAHEWTTSGELVVIDAQTNAVEGIHSTGIDPGSLAYSELAQIAVLPTPIVPDGLAIIGIPVLPVELSILMED